MSIFFLTTYRVKALRQNHRKEMFIGKDDEFIGLHRGGDEFPIRALSVRGDLIRLRLTKKGDLR